MHPCDVLCRRLYSALRRLPNRNEEWFRIYQRWLAVMYRKWDKETVWRATRQLC